MQRLINEVEAWIEDEVARLGNPLDHARDSARLTGARSTSGSVRSVTLARPGRSTTASIERGADPIGMVIDHTGLSVRAPSWVSIREIELALRERAEWVIKTLAEWRGRDKEALPAQWREGAGLLYRGRPLTLALFPARKKTIAADLLHLTVLHPEPGRRGRNRGLRRPVAQGTGAGAARAAGTAFREPGDAYCAAGKALQRPHAVGQLQSQGRNTAALAPGATAAARSPITSSPTRSRIWSSSTTRRASGRWSNRCSPATWKRAASSTR